MIPLHTRFRFAPSGDLHAGHVAVAWLNHQAAMATGGTFLLRIEQLKAGTGPGRVDQFIAKTQSNIDELCSIGLGPTEDAVLQSFDMDPSWAVGVLDNRGLTDMYWEKLGLKKIFGAWPQPMPYSLSSILGCYEQGHAHPYIMLAQAIEDVHTRRTCVIRGSDLIPEANCYNMLMQAVALDYHNLDAPDLTAQVVANQYYVPRLSRSGTKLPDSVKNEWPQCQLQDGSWSIGSSLPATTEGFFIKDLVEASIPAHKIYSYVGKLLFGSAERMSEAAMMWCREEHPVTNPATLQAELPPGWGVQSGPHHVMAMLPSNGIVIDDDDYFRFLHTGEVYDKGE